MKYAIKVPYLSQGKQKSYNKQMIIFKLHDRVSNEKYYKAAGTIFLKDGEWLSNKSNTHSGMIEPGLPIQTSVVGNVDSCKTEHLIFNSLHLAQISKILLIKDLKQYYLSEIESWKILCKENVPEHTEELDKLTELYPEEFV